MVDDEWAVSFDQHAWSLWRRMKVKSQHESSVWVERQWTLLADELRCSMKAYEKLKPEITFSIRWQKYVEFEERENGKNH